MGFLKVFFKLLLVVVILAGALAFVFSTQKKQYVSVEINSDLHQEITGKDSVSETLTVKPVSEQQIIDAVLSTSGAITVSGVQYSLGGQMIYPNSLYLDMSDFDAVLNFDTEKKQITVQSGITWKQIQQVIDPHNLSVKVMPEQNDYSVGGSLSVNAHGYYVGAGPVINSVKSIRIILADGQVYEASAETNNALYYGAIGGYGGMGVITQVTLELTDNVAIERSSRTLGFNEFNDYFRTNILTDDKVVMHYAKIYPPNYEYLLDVSWRITDKPLTDEKRLQQNEPEPWWDYVFLDLKPKVGIIQRFYKNLIDPYIYSKPEVVKRNLESSYSLLDSGYIASDASTIVQQEYLIPVHRFEIFALNMREVLSRYKVPVYKILLSYVPLKNYANTDAPVTHVYSFKIIYRQEKNAQSQSKVNAWTKRLVKATIESHGQFILPYPVYDEADQLYQAYPVEEYYFDIKKQVDPDGRFTNLFWQQYQDSMFANHVDKLQVPVPVGETTIN